MKQYPLTWVDYILIPIFLVLVFGMIFAIGVCAEADGKRMGRREVWREAIEHGYAEYDSKTGELRWKEQ